MKLKYLFLFLSIGLFFQNQYLTLFEKGNGNQSATYQETVNYYDNLAQNFDKIKVLQFGLTDSNEPLRLVIFNPDKNFNPTDFKNKAVILINNGIHPGEPDGIDATMMMMRDYATGKLKAPKNTIIAAIEVYNIGGMLNRGSFSRANQNGPEEYGFRGNARNLDLNRDFIKTDSKNSASFQEIFHILNPDVLIDNHVSDGADYQYTLTYILTNKERLGNILGNFYHGEMTDWIVKDLRKKNIDPIPYVEVEGESPLKGFTQFMDSPRYSTGYTSLFNTIGTIPETHMLKPYKDRVKVTYENMLSYINYTDHNYLKIKELRQKNLEQYLPEKSYSIQFAIDSTKFKTIDFKGFEDGMRPSAISGFPRLFYDRTKPYTKKIKYYDTYKSTKEIIIPSYYIVPQSEWQVLNNLKRNNIQFSVLKSDSLITVQSYKIKDFKTVSKPYEGHYLHSNTDVSTTNEKVQFKKGDYLIPLKQNGVKYLLETLEPAAVDSFFNWNYFDSFLGQKEYFSAYVFEDTAEKLLKENPTLKQNFEKKKTEDSAFAKNGSAQLDWIYRNSKYFEKSLNQYPIYRIP
ncbi:M14 family metallopeptidase [Halpernia frigidisoli]|uniref:Zinc carboxypeptidase n=1 Tax=Halpernia frigidisoli TaxID=1125876 RepID=A0A1I3HIT6_9FLAO|nr:hypothetical protein [Halpernia frigidisoli]SFI35420.1 hypothetical protein SAMN05443292_2223 [Halpernia frigidisoli]